MKQFISTHQLRFGLIVLSLFSFLASHAITIYFKDTNNSWGGVNIYIWGATIGTDNTSGWPGKAMVWKATNGSDTWYKIELQSTTASMKFNKVGDSDASQTSDFNNVSSDGWFDSGSSGIQPISGLPFWIKLPIIHRNSYDVFRRIRWLGCKNSHNQCRRRIFTLVKLYTKIQGLTYGMVLISMPI